MKRNYLKEDDNQTLVEAANTVFEHVRYERYKAIKSRYGDVIVGAEYSKQFVQTYAKENVNVYISRRNGGT